MPEERARDVNKLHLIFAIASIAMAAGVIWMIIDDYAREWKRWQRKFYQIDYEKTIREIRKARDEIDRQRMEELRRQRAAAEARRAQQRKELEAAQAELEALRGELYKANQEFQFAKSRFSAARYEYEVLAASGKKEAAERARRRLEQRQREQDERERELRALEAKQAALQERIARAAGNIAEIDKEMARLNETVDRLSNKLQRIEPSFVNVYFRNAPLLDFMNPSIKVQQVVLKEVYNDLNFMLVPRVDRCMTCHVPIDQKGYEEFPHPFKSHPRLDLFVDSKSKHPMERFGCTVCHQGRDRGTSFYTAVHTPRDQEQRKKWEEEYDWHPFKHWDFPMLPSAYTQASCFKCHSSQTTIPQADELNKGLLLFERAGCFGCHKTRGFENLRKVGPSLLHISSKLTPEWTFKWIKDPKGFRPTRMPKFFDLTNTSDPESLARNNVEAHGIVAYLFKVSEPIKYPRIDISGDPKRGEDLVKNIGCLACHTVDPNEKLDITDHRSFGPNLAKTGSKTNAVWLYHWLKDPKHYFPQTFMPNLRLSDQEARDITAYLMSLRDREFEQKPVPALDRAALDRVALDYLKATMTDQEARQKLSTMNIADKQAFVGERAIARYGCYACHDIKGFEKAQPIGVELTEEGSKNIHQLDFGFVKIEHTRQAWFYQKLKDPRIFDVGKVKRPEEKLKMPDFQFTDDEIRALVTAILSFTKEKVAPEITRRLDARETYIEEGRRVIRRYNCQGCHVIDGVGGDIRKTIADPGFHPPPLTGVGASGEGAKVKPEWLFQFIKSPSTIRPWLRVRMPTFGLKDEEINKLVRYFALLDKVDFPFQDYQYRFDPNLIAVGRTLFNNLQCAQCHQSVQAALAAGKTPADLAPDLAMARERLRPDWIDDWLLDPQRIQPGTRMPTFFPEGQSFYPNLLGGDARRQIEALRAYVLSLGRGNGRPEPGN